MAIAKDQNAALHVACGELQQLLAMQKAAAADCLAVSSPCQEPKNLRVQRKPLRITSPASPDTLLSAAACMPGIDHHGVQTETGPGRMEQLADMEKHITQLRAALAVSERQRESQATAHKQELEALHASLGQVGGASACFSLARVLSGVSSLRSQYLSGVLATLSNLCICQRCPTACFALSSHGQR